MIETFCVIHTEIFEEADQSALAIAVETEVGSGRDQTVLQILRGFIDRAERPAMARRRIARPNVPGFGGLGFGLIDGSSKSSGVGIVGIPAAFLTLMDESGNRLPRKM